MRYTIALLQQGRGRKARVSNEAVFAGGYVCGIGIAVPDLATRCRTNIAPESRTGSTTRTVAGAALSCSLPPAGTTLAATDASLDTFTAMAVLAMRADGVVIVGAVLGGFGKLMEVIDADAEWRPLDGRVPIAAPQALEAIASRMDRAADERVGAIRAWLETERFPGMEAAFGQARRDRAAQLRLANRVWLAAGDQIAVLVARSRFARRVALSRAAVAILDNPAYRAGHGAPHRRVTVALRDPRPLKLELVREELDTIELGWGPKLTALQTMIHSPRGRSCTIALPRIIIAVGRTSWDARGEGGSRR